jgi:hypothetical protein
MQSRLQLACGVVCLVVVQQAATASGKMEAAGDVRCTGSIMCFDFADHTWGFDHAQAAAEAAVCCNSYLTRIANAACIQCSLLIAAMT